MQKAKKIGFFFVGEFRLDQKKKIKPTKKQNTKNHLYQEIHQIPSPVQKTDLKIEVEYILPALVNFKDHFLMKYYT